MTALLARIISFVPGISTGVALIIVNACAVMVAVLAGVELAQDLGRRPVWGALLALPAALPASFALDLTEPVAWAGVLVGLLAVRRRAWGWATVALTVAVLARETAGVVVFGLAIESGVLLARRRAVTRFPLRLLAIPVVVASAWQLWLWHTWGTLPLTQGLATVNVGSVQHAVTDRTGTGGSAIPVYGIAKTFLSGLATGDTSNLARGVSYLIERLSLVALLATSGWLLATRRVRAGLAVTTAWIVAAAVALTVSAWVVDVQFLRAAMEAAGLSVFVLLQYRSRLTNAVLGFAGFVTLLVAIEFVGTV
jgi:hypothetical protein